MIEKKSLTKKKMMEKITNKQENDRKKVAD